MSYQQTRSTQDPGFYPKPISGELDLTTPSPATIIYKSSTGRPIEEDRVESSVFPFTGANAALINYPATSPNERTRVNFCLTMYMIDGPAIGTSAAQTGNYDIVVTANDAVGSFSAGGQFSGFTLPGYGLTQVSPGNTSIIQINCSAAGNCAITMASRITRAIAS